MTDTTPPLPTTKQLRVTVDTHERIMRLAAHLNGTADDAIRNLLGRSTVRVPVTDIQRERWAAAAKEAGVSLPEFVAMRVEGAVEYGFDPGTMGLIYAHVTALSRAAGLTVHPRPQRSTESTDSRP